LIENNLSDSNWNTVQFQISTVDLGLPKPLSSLQVDLGPLPNLGPSLPHRETSGLGFPFPALCSHTRHGSLPYSLATAGRQAFWKVQQKKIPENPL